MRTIRLIHKWTGLLIGLFFLFSCLSGAVILIGKLTGSYAPFFAWAKRFHTTLCLGAVGRRIIAIATLLALVEVLTGYLLWGQRTRALARSRGSIWAALPKTLGFTFPNLRLGFHSAAGFWAGIPLLVMILTALPGACPWLHLPGNFHTLRALHSGAWDLSLIQI